MLIQLPGGSALSANGEEVAATDNGEIALHTPKALSRLIEFWKNKPNLAGLLSSYTDAVQDLENVIWDVFVSRLADYAADAQLDGLGNIVGEPRNGLGDAAYRARIKARILINQSLGRASDVIKVLRAIDPTPFHLFGAGTAAFRVYYDAPLLSDQTAAQVASIVKETRAAGIGATVAFPTDDARGARYGSVYDPTLNAARGWGSVYDATAGGLYAHIVVA